MRLIDADELRKAIISKIERPTPNTIRPFTVRGILEIIESQPTVKLTVDNMPRYTHNLPSNPR